MFLYNIQMLTNFVFRNVKKDNGPILKNYHVITVTPVCKALFQTMSISWGITVSENNVVSCTGTRRDNIEGILRLQAFQINTGANEIGGDRDEWENLLFGRWRHSERMLFGLVDMIGAGSGR